MDATTTSESVGTSYRKKTASFTQRETMWGLAFLSPWILGFILFTALPMVASLIFSLTTYNPIHPDQIRFIGLANYVRLFSDQMVGKSVLVTLRFALISVPLGLAFPLFLALLVNSKNLLGKNLFRTFFYMPYMVPVVAGVMIWGGILNSDSGWLNIAIKGIFGVQGPAWLTSEEWVVPSLVIMGFWGAGNFMLTFLAGLQNVPTELYEAATVDGAGPVIKFFSITIPMISPILFYNLVLSLIGSFQYFTQAYIIGNGRGDPNGATLFYNLYLYKTAFAFLDMGYGSTLAWAMFIVVLVLTVILFQTSKSWVYYAGGD